MNVQAPRLLDNDLSELRRLSPSELELQLSTEETNKATMTLHGGEDIPGMHALVEIYTLKGSAGIYRVVGNQRDYRENTAQITLYHVIDMLSDQLYPGEFTYNGTVAGYITSVLDAQSVTIRGQKPWKLGVCEDTADYAASSQNADLRKLLRDLQDHEQDYQLTFDTSEFPWTMNLIKKIDTVTSEFRLSRNVSDCSISATDTEMCTRLYVVVKSDTGEDDTTKVYNSTLAQQLYGLISKTVEVNARDYTSIDAFAEKYLNDRCKPTLQITIDGYELSTITGETYDELKLGQLSRVAIPEYGDTFEERLVSVDYPDLVNTPEKVTVSLASKAFSAVSSLATLAETATETVATLDNAGIVKTETGEWKFSSGKSGGGGVGSLKADIDELGEKTGIDELGENETLYLRLVQADGKITENEEKITTIEGSSLWQNRDAVVGAVGRVDTAEGKISAIEGSALWQTRDTITGLVGRVETAEGEIRSIEGSTLWTQRDSITAATGQMHVEEYEDTAGNKKKRLVIDSGGGLYIDRGGTQMGVWDSGNLTAGIIVGKLNDQKDAGEKTYTRLKADVVDLGAYATVERLQALEGEFNKLIVGDLVATKIRTNDIVADQIFSNSYISELTPEGQDNPYNLHLGLHAISIENEVKARFIGTTDVNFKVADTQWFKNYVSALTLAWTDGTYGPEYDEQSHSYTVPVEIVDSNNEVLKNDIWFSGTEAYTNGQTDANAAVTLSKSWTGSMLTVGNSANSRQQSTVITLAEGAWNYNSETGQYEKPIAARADSEDRVSITINGSTPYQRGVEAGITEGEGHFSPTSVTLQGAAAPVVPINGYTGIRLGAAATLYPDGGEIGILGSQKSAREVLASGGAVYYRANEQKTYYSRSTRLSFYGKTTLYYKDGNGAYHEAKTDVGWYYTNSQSGAYYLCDSGTVVTPISSATAVRLSTTTTTMYESGGTVHKIGDGLTAFPVVTSGGTVYYQPGDQLNLYQAGTTVTDRYYIHA